MGYLDLLTTETIKLLGSIKSKITKGYDLWNGKKCEMVKLYLN